jgi:hypothetical protein
MGYLNNSTVTVDAILTTKGREALSKGSSNGLDIRYFALGDDEVNYDLWNPAHPLGSDYYGIIIENMPVLEASPIPEQNLKSKLITLPKSTTTLTTINSSSPEIGSSTNPVQYNENGAFISSPVGSPVTVTFSLSSAGGGNNDILGYTVTFDSRFVNVISTGLPPGFTGTTFMNTTLNTSATTAIGDIGSNLLTSTITSGGISIILRTQAGDLPSGNSVQNIFVQGNEVGGQLTIPVYFKRGNVVSGGSN